MNNIIPYQNTLPASPHDREIMRIVGRLQDALIRHPDLRHDNRDGSRFYVRVKPDIDVICGQYVVVGVDIQRLWHIDSTRLIRKDVIGHLSIAVGRPIRPVWSDGELFYVIEWSKRTAGGNLPKTAHLDLSTRPEGRYMIPLGISQAGAEWRDITTLGDILIGGVKGSGKSSLYHAILAALLTSQSPIDLRIALIDPKRVEFSLWARAPHLLYPVATTPDEAGHVTGKILAEVEQRLKLFADIRMKNLSEYNAAVAGPARLPHVVLFVDEFVELAVLGGLRSPFYRNLIRLTSIARAAGVQLLLAATNPKSEIVNTLARDNCDARFAFRCTTSHQSRAIIMRSGAETIPDVPGRMLVSLSGMREPIRMQSFYIEPARLREIADSLTASPASVQNALEFSEAERAIVRYMLNGASFGIESAASALAGTVSRRQILNFARRFSSAGWLEPVPGSQGRVLSRGFFDDAGNAMDRDGLIAPEQDRTLEGIGRSGDQTDQTDQTPEDQQKRRFLFGDYEVVEGSDRGLNAA